MAGGTDLSSAKERRTTKASGRNPVTGNGALIILMGFLFLFLGYLGVPVAFALIASVLIVTALTPSAKPQ